MAGNENEEIFKTTLMGGYDKDDVMRQIQKMKEEAYAEKSKLLLNIKEKEGVIADLRQKLADKDAKIDGLEKDIKGKYQSYIDNYDMISQLVYETRVHSDQVLGSVKAEKEKLLAGAREEAQRSREDARKEADACLSQARDKARSCLEMAQREAAQCQAAAREEAQRLVSDAQKEADTRLAEGKKKYAAVQEELNGLVEMVNQVQKRFMESYKAVHALLRTMPAPMQELEDDMEMEED